VFVLIRLAAAYAWIAAALLAFGWISGIEDGPVAVLQLLSPHIALATLLAIPIAVATRSRPLALPVVATMLLLVLRFGGEWTSPAVGSAPAIGSASDELMVATWNIQSGSGAGDIALELLRATPVDIVAIQELTPEVAAAIEADAGLTARYPHRVLEGREGVSGAGILSRYPIESAEYAREPVRIEARLRLPVGELVVLNAHPFPARINLWAGIPAGMDPVERNDETERLRARVAELEGAGLDVLLIGDFNTAPTEVAFGRLTTGLHDAHADVGWGPGWTWRPARFAFLGIGLLRIDLILSTPDLVPVGTSVTCPAAGDHCLVEATLVIDR
jgi:endonuclease/exonuclease/phosphatase family metal-dependent hydrolase